MDKTETINNHHGHELILHASFPWHKPLPKSVTLLCHGFLSSITSLPIAPLFAILAKDTPVVTFNFVGKGEQIPTYSDCIDDLFDVITHLSAKGVKEITLVGHSMGGIICLLTAQRLADVKVIKKLVLMSMPHDIRGFRTRYNVPVFKPGEEFKYITIQGKKHRISKSFIEDIYIYNVEKALRSLRIPTLIIQGNKDSIISVSDATKIYDELFGGQVKWRRRKYKKIIPGAGHLFKGKKNTQSLALEIEAFLIKKYPSS